MISRLGLKGFLFVVCLHNVYFGVFNNPGGLTPDKFLLFLVILYFLKTAGFKQYKLTVNGICSILFNAFFVFSILSFLRGVFTGLEEDRVQNAFNPVISLSVIVPFVLFMSFDSSFSLKALYRTNLLITKIGVGLVVVSTIFPLNPHVVKAFIDPSFFLIIFLGVNIEKKHRFWIIAGAICYLYYGIAYDNRTVLLRVFLQFGFLLLFTFGEKILTLRQLRRVVLIFLTLIPVVSLAYYYTFFGESQVNIGSNNISNEDTRTFLYMEVWSDLERNEDLILGKGTLGKYFSYWFYEQMGVDDVVDTFNRSLVEVGVLSYLLRGGLVLTFLFVILLVVFASKLLLSGDVKLRAIAYVIFNHVLVSFIENIPRFFIYDVIFWLLVGHAVHEYFKTLPVNKMQIDLKYGSN